MLRSNHQFHRHESLILNFSWSRFSEHVLKSVSNRKVMLRMESLNSRIGGPFMRRFRLEIL